MLDILKGIAGRVWLPVAAWIFPSALAVLAVWFLITPLATSANWPIAVSAEKLTVSEATSWLVGISVVLGILLYALSTPLYRFLEGYSWPRPLRAYAVDRQRQRVGDLKHRIAQGVVGQEWELSLLQELLARYPADANQIAPTRLGNALRAFETFGVNRFGLDSQTLWTELRTVVPQHLAAETDVTRCLVDFFVAIIYLTVAFAFAAFAAIASGHRCCFISDWLLVLVPLAVAPFAYRMALVACSSWSASVQALVNLGRKPLAEALGLQLPPTLKAEREMWETCVRFVFYGNASRDGDRLNRFRIRVTTGSIGPRRQKPGRKKGPSRRKAAGNSVPGSSTNAGSA